MENVQTQAVTKLHQIKPSFAIPLVIPVTTNEKIMEAWNNFNDLKLRLLDDKDFVKIQGEQFAKKSTFRKLALAFGISTEIIKEERRELKNGFGYEISMKAISPSGRFMTAIASCHSNERKFSKDSDVRAIAQTRSTNRCIADLIGWSAPSAEEMLTDIPNEKPTDSKDNSEEMDHEYFDNMFQEADNEQANVPSNDDLITGKQKNLLMSLFYQKITDTDERSRRMDMIDSLSKSDASEAIGELLEA